MSTPPNPLSQYNTYSYHHIFIACDSTVVAEELQKSSEFETFLRTPEQRNTDQKPFGKYEPRTYKGGKYSIIINGMVDSEYVIKSAEWISITAASAGGDQIDRFSTMTSEGSLTIEEPRGVKFMNVMSEVANKMETDPNGIVFLLKTIFVGHTSEGTSYKFKQTSSEGEESILPYEPITNIRPILFIMYNITGQFRVEGGTYTVEFVGVNNGASKQKHIMRATDQISINFGDNSTLHNGLKALQNEINRIYKIYYNETKDEIENAKDEKGNPLKLQFNGREVEYIIQAEEPYAVKTKKVVNGLPVFNSEPAYLINDFPQQQTDKGTEDEGGVIHFGNEKSVESAIMKIVNRCERIKDEGVYSENKKTGEKVRYIPKVTSTLISTDEKFQVIYKLRRVLEGRSDVIEKVIKRKTDNAQDADEDITRNLLTLDYFYTGRNTDIIDFDIRMDMGLAFFQTLVTSDNYPTPQQVLDGAIEEKRAGTTDISIKGENGKIRKKTPLFFPTKSKDSVSRNTVHPAKSSDFQSMLNRHAALENLEAKVIIHGNPGLLNATNKMPTEVANHANKNETEANKFADLFPYWETTPAIVQLNIKMPSNEEDTDFSLPFWFEGFYYCFGITHKFDGGEFTQQLDMISLPQEAPIQKQQKEKQKTQQKEQADKTKAAATSSKDTGTTGGGASKSGTSTSTTQSSAPIDNPAEITAKNHVAAYFTGGRYE